MTEVVILGGIVIFILWYRGLRADDKNRTDGGGGGGWDHDSDGDGGGDGGGGD